MKTFKNITIVLIILLTLNSCSSDEAQAPDVNGNTQINFDSKIGTADFALNTPFTIAGQSYKFERLRYWVSDLKLVGDQNKTYSLTNSFFLMEETNEILVQDKYKYAAAKRETIDLTNVPSGSYTKIIFSIGIDATHNDNMSIQNGELSQLNGMTNVSWMWHTSYIFSSLIGKNVTPTTPVALSVETGLNTNYRTVEITLPTALVVSASKTAKLNLNVDVEKIVKDIDLVTNPKVSANKPELMAKVADNYKNNVFTFKSIE
ncbi:MbnP family protein [Flavobacterium tructae]|uniref:MbnP family protein n=1 Tax=Flavobacterium tructae TaxID=1114873 RepID=UPI0035A905C6